MTGGKFPRYGVPDKVFKELAEVDELFCAMKLDKSLPTFQDFFIDCVIKGTAHEVNLEKMFPSHFRRVSDLLKRLGKSVVSDRKKAQR